MTGPLPTHRGARAPQRAAPPDDALARFARLLTHDVNNYLAAMLSRAELLALDLPAHSPLQADVAELVASAEELRRYLRRVAVFAAPQHASDDRGGFDDRVRTAVDRLRSHHPALAIDLVLEAADAECLVSAPRLGELLAPLIENARDAMAGTVGRVTVRTACRDEADGRPGVALMVRDEGAGVAPAMAAVAFEPLASTRKVRGAGLSLAILRRTVHAEGGHVSLEPATPRGTVATLWLPRPR